MNSTSKFLRSSSRVMKARMTVNNNMLRNLNLHEYQSHALFRKYDINVPRGEPASTVAEALSVAESFGQGVDAVVKAQVLAGGRGRGKFGNGFQGGVHVTYDREEVGKIAAQMLQQTLYTKQTGARGRPCNLVYVQERLYPRREMYLAFLLDRKSSQIVIMGSKMGGMNIEEVAEEHPEAITKIYANAESGLKPGQAEKMAYDMGFTSKVVVEAARQIERLFKLFIENDATMLEINPMIETHDQQVVCADAKVNIDDNASFRNSNLFEQRDETQEDPRDIQAAKFDLQYIGLDGNIGCIVNGAGLAMATMDIIKLKNGEPANFLDVGGSATKEQIYEALKIIHSDSRVMSILVNVFGGIMRCDVIAQGLIEAVQDGNFTIPIILRLDGTKRDEGIQLIRESGLKRIIISNDLDDAASKAVLCANIIKDSNDMGVYVSFKPLKGKSQTLKKQFRSKESL